MPTQGLPRIAALCKSEIQANGGVALPFVVLSPTEERRAREWPLETAELPEGHLEDWLEKRAKRLSSAPSIRYRPQGCPSSFLMEVS